MSDWSCRGRHRGDGRRGEACHAAVLLAAEGKNSKATRGTGAAGAQAHACQVHSKRSLSCDACPGGNPSSHPRYACLQACMLDSRDAASKRAAGVPDKATVHKPSITCPERVILSCVILACMQGMSQTAVGPKRRKEAQQEDLVQQVASGTVTVARLEAALREHVDAVDADMVRPPLVRNLPSQTWWCCPHPPSGLHEW